MQVLILKNIQTEGPETIEDYLVEKGVSYKVVDLYAGESIPDAQNFKYLIIMGGPMSVNDDIDYIRREELLVKEFIKDKKKVLGVCLGAQIIAKALNSKVYSGKEKEIGWYNIELTQEGLSNPLMETLLTSENKSTVFQWHGETFDVPKGAIRLAGSELFKNQAFKYDQNVFAFQFHIEVKKETIFKWLKEEKVDISKIQTETEKQYIDYVKRAYKFYEVFFNF